MKVLLRLLLATLTLTICSSVQAQQQVIAFWDFNDGFVVQDETPQIVHQPTIGSGVLYQQRAETDGNGKDGNPFTSAELGIDTSTNLNADQAIAWDDFANAGDNDAEFFMVVSTLGFENIEISFDYQGNDDDLDGDGVNVSDGFIQYDARFSLLPLIEVTVPDVGPVVIKDFDGASTDLLPTGTSVAVINSSTIFQRDLLMAPASVNNQAVFAFRLDEFEGNDSVRFDNVLITGTPMGDPALCGDVDLSGVVDFLDIAPFIILLSTPGAFQAEADCNLNGLVDFLDIAPFIAALAGN